MPTQKNIKDAEHKAVSTRILYGLIVGTIIGVIFNYWGENPIREAILENVVTPLGQLFLRSLFMVIVPLVFSSLTCGVTNLGSVGHVGRLGWRLGAYYVATTFIAILIGQVLVLSFQPGLGVSEDYIHGAQANLSEQVEGLMSKSKMVNKSLWPGIVSKIVPKNVIEAFAEGNMLAVIFVSILFGLALLSINKEKSLVTQNVLHSISDASIKIIGWIMKFAPYAVAALMIGAVSRFGIEIMGNVLMYMGVVILAFLLHFFGTYGLLIKYIIKIPLKEFFKRAYPAQVTAFSTSSSNATMPTTIHTLEKRFGVPESITTFSIPIGATVNMDGTAMFECVAAIFVAQVFGVDISLTGHLTLVFLVLFTSIGVAGVPGGSIPILMSAMAMLGIPPEGIALVLGVDRLLDMCRTTINVTGDMSAALYLSRVEKVPLEANFKKIPV